MRRRDALMLLGGAAAASALPPATRAQQAMPVIGYLNGQSAGDRPHLPEAFRQGLGGRGYVAGRNVSIEYRYGDNSMDRLREHAADLISRKVAVIVATGGNNSALAAKALTSTIPILFTSGLDPVHAGLVASLGRPEGNVTGVSWFSVEMPPKQIELLREMLPHATVFGLFIDPNNQESSASEVVARHAAPAFGVRLLVLKPSTPDEINAAFETLARERVDAAIVGSSPYYTSIAKEVIALAERHRIPVAYSNSRMGRGGWAGRLRQQHRRCLSPGRELCRKPPQGRQARRSARRPRDKVRAHYQSEGRQGARPDAAALAAQPRRRGDRLSTARTITVTVNGKKYTKEAPVRLTLADFLRDELGLTGTHLGCEHGVCGACTMLLDGAAGALLPDAGGAGRRPRDHTVEGIAPSPDKLHPLQEAFRDNHGLQCGFCTPGMLTTLRIPARQPRPDRARGPRVAISGNLCRCTGYQGIVLAALDAAKRMKGAKA